MSAVGLVKTFVANFVAAVLVLLLIAVILLTWRGVQVQSPSRWETRLAGVAKHTVLVGGKGLRNPLPKTPNTAEEGRQSFAHYCFACHGLDGQNTGVPFSDAMSPAVPSLASREVQGYSDGQLHWIIRNGLWPSGMPASRGILTDDEIWSIVTYIRNLPPAGSLGEPPAYNQEDRPGGKELPSSRQRSH